MTATSKLTVKHQVIHVEEPDEIHEPLMVNRHYVKNYFDLLEDTFRRIYAARNLPGDITIHPGRTIADGFNLTEQKIVGALFEDSENPSSLVRFIYTILTDEGKTKDEIDYIFNRVRANLGGSFEVTFAQIADALEEMFAGLIAFARVTPDTSDDELIEKLSETVVGAVRSIGTVVADVLATTFEPLALSGIALPQVPVLTKKTTTWSVNIEGNYLAVISGDLSEVLDIKCGNEKIEIAVHVKQFIITDDARFSVTKTDKKGPHNYPPWLMRDVGTLALRDITLALRLRSDLTPVAFSGEPSGDAQRASFTNESVVTDVAEVDLDLHDTVAPLLIGTGYAVYELFKAGTLNLKFISELEEAVSDAIRDGINSASMLGDLEGALRDFVVPIAEALVPTMTGLSKVQYKNAWGTPQGPREIPFAGLRTGYGVHCVSLRNAGKVQKEEEIDHYDPDPPRGPDKPDEIDVGPKDRMGSSVERRMAPAASTPSGTQGGAGLGSTLIHDQFEDILLTPVSEKEKAIPFPIDPSVWKLTYAAASPIESDLGSAHDPSWVALSTNCVVASRLYRALQNNGKLAHSGEVNTVSYEVEGCDDIAADFTGQSFDGAPALAIQGLVVQASEPSPDARILILSPTGQVQKLPAGRYKFDLRIRLNAKLADFITLEPHTAYDPQQENASQPIQILNLQRLHGPEDDIADCKEPIRAVVTDWVKRLPTPSILINCFSNLKVKARRARCQDGWIVVHADYPFPNFSEVGLFKTATG